MFVRPHQSQGENGLKTLPPQHVTDTDYADVRRQLERIFYDIIFKPLVDLLAPHSHQVSKSAKAIHREFRNAAPSNAAVIAAINAGRIQYRDGVFSGDFNAIISRSLLRTGAKFSKAAKTFTIAPNQVPPDIRVAAEHYHHLAKKVHDEAMAALDAVENDLTHLTDKHQVDATIMVGKVQKGYAKTVGDALGNSELSDESRAKLKKQYAESLKPYIKSFSADTIHELRETIEANSLQGYRFDTLMKRIQNRYDVSKSKAELLARTETARYVSKHRQARFAESGITQYVWQTAGDARVRDDHKKLHGQIFSFNHPPIIDDRTGERGNPGEIYNCRCVARALLPSVENYTQPDSRENSTRKNSTALEAVPC